MPLPPRALLALLAVVLLAGCNENDDRGAERTAALQEVEGTLNLERSQTGPPDAGTRGGHGADRYLLRARDATATVTGTVRPASAAIELVDEAGARVARANVAPDGRFVAALPELPRRGSVTFRLTARSGSAQPWKTGIVASRAPAAERRARAARDVRVPARDRTPPAAILLLRSGGRVVSSTAPVRADRDPPIRLAGPSVALTALIRDRDGGTGRIRASLTYRRICPDSAGGRRVVPRVHHFPPAEIARVQLPPGALAPAERRRRARLRLALRPGCVLRGKAWADATNASGLESFSDQIRFELGRV